jgi:hypothetical protein
MQSMLDLEQLKKENQELSEKNDGLVQNMLDLEMDESDSDGGGDVVSKVRSAAWQVCRGNKAASPDNRNIQESRPLRICSLWAVNPLCPLAPLPLTLGSFA